MGVKMLDDVCTEIVTELKDRLEGNTPATDWLTAYEGDAGDEALNSVSRNI